MRPRDFKAMVAKPIKVVQMLPELNTGGVERGTLEMGTHLCKQGHHSVVISGGGRLVPELVNAGSRHITWCVGRKSPRVLQYFFPLRRFLTTERVDILHVRSRVPAWLACWVLKSIPEPARPRFVTTFHGFYSINRYSAVMTKGERVIAISKGVASHMMAHYGVAEDKIGLIYRGVDETVFDPALVSHERVHRLRRKWNIDDAGPPVIILPGRLARWKGQDIFIESLSRMADLPWTALCIGDTEDNPSRFQKLQDRVLQRGLENRIRFVGHCDDMPAAYLLSDLVVSASSTEPEAFGRIAVEAQAMARPVVATAHGGSLETVLEGKTGWLVPPRDAASLSTALTAAIGNKGLREQLGHAGRKWVMENFTISRMCEKTLALYESLLYQDGSG